MQQSSFHHPFIAKEDGDDPAALLSQGDQQTLTEANREKDS